MISGQGRHSCKYIAVIISSITNVLQEIRKRGIEEGGA